VMRLSSLTSSRRRMRDILSTEDALDTILLEFECGRVLETLTYWIFSTIQNLFTSRGALLVLPF
jgi:hypothetical protein